MIAFTRHRAGSARVLTPALFRKREREKRRASDAAAALGMRRAGRRRAGEDGQRGTPSPPACGGESRGEGSGQRRNLLRTTNIKLVK